MPQRDCSRGSYLTELRRSHAAGVHNTKPTRTELNRRAVNMSMLDEDWPDAEPTEEELMSVELYDDELDLDDDEYYPDSDGVGSLYEDYVLVDDEDDEDLYCSVNYSYDRDGWQDEY